MCYVLFFLFLASACDGASAGQVRTLYNSLNPHSISQFLAFYELYPDTPEGQKALQRAWSMLSADAEENETLSTMVMNSASTIQAIIDLVNKPAGDHTPLLEEEDLALIERLTAKLPNRQLKGHRAETETEVLTLPSHEVDLARGMLLSQFAGETDLLSRVRSYEAALDLMALQILAKLPFNASAEQKVQALNTYIFEEMGYRFPPHSQYAKEVDVYSFLPSVLDSRKGVCLGVSILYLCLSQRLDLPLEMITPPGHIYVRYHDGKKIINIETTARGVDVDSEVYLSVDTRSLQQRTIKEVIGLAHFNQASIFLQNGAFDKALTSYQRAHPYLPDDFFLKELMGYSMVLSGKTEEGKALLGQVKGHLPDYAVSKTNMAEDYLNGKVNEEGLRSIFISVDETRQSLINKREHLENALKEHPEFRAGKFSLAATWLQLHRMGEALKHLKEYHLLDADDPTAEYYLAVLHMERMDYTTAWKHLAQAEKITTGRNHRARPLIDLRRHLMEIAPQ